MSVLAEKRALVINPLHPRDPALVNYFGGSPNSTAGETVTADTALQEETVLRCVRYIAESIAGLPLHLQEDVNPRGSRKVTEHWVYKRLHSRPNRYQTAFDFRNQLFQHVLLRGNLYALIQPSKILPPFELIPLHPDRIKHVELDNGDRFYDYQTPKNGTIRLRFGEVFHMQFMPGIDGWKGRSVIEYARDSIGRGMAATKYGGRFFSNYAAPGGILKSKKRLNPEAKKQLKEDWQQMYTGNNARRTAVLEDDLDWQQVTMSNDDAQFLQTMTFSAETIAGRIFGVPLHKVGLLLRATNNNIEQQAIEAVVDCLLPWCIRFEQSADRDLLTESEQARYYVKHNLSGLLRGDFFNRQQGLQIMRQNGVIDGNDWADKEEMNPFDGGDIRIVPLNMTRLQDVGVQAVPGSPPAGSIPADPNAADGIDGEPSVSNQDGQQRERRSLQMGLRLRNAYSPLFEDASRRLLRREADAIERQFRRQAQTRGLADFIGWVDTFYSEHRDTMSQVMAPVVAGYCELVAGDAAFEFNAQLPDLSTFVSNYTGALVSRHLAESRLDLMNVVMTGAEPDAIMDGLDGLLRGWRNQRPKAIAAREAVRAANAVSCLVWQEAGVTQLRWVKSGDCLDCDALSGQVIDIRGEFAPQIQHPPLHDGCQCSLRPA